jgi:hypothetical protein
MVLSLKAVSRALARTTQRALIPLARLTESPETAYLNGAVDRVDLELRMREVDARRFRQDFYPTNFSWQ